ncbi:hypothetical protein TTHERM_01016060 (macronuclear) [Tetrahymena thermophila SB210]|uniref:Uncharacterized protein n=1 Tax=Tetrahymena thermophila (strain SB210) TaxID=312017 RepID=Q22CT5_TETTS|nr:hypothetical protein TTHERM_01016060 [Tetrahymena thermophila SB210]EAR83103.2 hypothetical protein TTHERM_01016060 [Tetrahymena thermophila SB210]|eukprot:XP_001030766.2 hypothetical protein TTHERM_01016060 [Tetrahymena thermophila SB210]
MKINNIDCQDFQEQAPQKPIVRQKKAQIQPADQQNSFFQDKKIEQCNQNQQKMENIVHYNQNQQKMANKQFQDQEHFQVLSIQPQKKDNKEIYFNTPYLKENKGALVNNTIYNRNININPLIKSRSSSLIKSRNNPNQQYQQIKLNNAYNYTYENYVDELKFCKNQNEYENTHKYKNQLFADILKDDMQQIFNETAKFGQKFNQQDSNNITANFLSIRNQHSSENTVRSNFSQNLTEQVQQQTKRKYSETEKYKYKQFINKQGNQTTLKEENENKLSQLVNINNSPTCQRVKYSSSSPNSIRIKQNNSFKFPKAIEYNNYNISQLNNSLKSSQNVSINQRDSSKKLNNNHIQQPNQNFNMQNNSQNNVLSNSSINKQMQAFYNTQNINTFDSDSYYIPDQQMNGDSRASLKSKGSRAGSPGGCRIKVLPIKTNKGVISEFQTVNSREGSPNSIRIKKYKYTENIDLSDNFQQNSKQL